MGYRLNVIYREKQTNLINVQKTNDLKKQKGNFCFRLKLENDEIFEIVNGN